MTLSNSLAKTACGEGTGGVAAHPQQKCPALHLVDGENKECDALRVVEHELDNPAAAPRLVVRSTSATCRVDNA